MSAIKIRLAEDADDEKIRDLSRRCPQEGVITFFPDRTPRFNTLHKILDEGAWHYVACKEDAIIGLVGVIHFSARVLDKIYKIGFMLDLRVDVEYRSGLAAFRLVKTAVDHLRESDVDMVIVNFLKDNKRPLVFTSGRGGLPIAQFLGDNKVFNIIPIHSMSLDKRFEIDEATEEDIPEIIELYHKYQAGFKIAPVITEELFRKYLHAIEGISLDNILLARENGKIKAVTGMWDEHTYKAYHALKLSFSIRAANAALKFLSLFMKVPHPIGLNEPLKQLSLVLYAHDERPEALETLFRHVNNINLGSEYTLITLYAQNNDPVFKMLKKFKGVAVNTEMYMFAKDESIFEKLKADPSPALFDLTMIL